MAMNNRPKGTKMLATEPAFDPVTAALKQLYSAIENEPVPEDFMRILDDIDAKIKGAKTATDTATDKAQ